MFYFSPARKSIMISIHIICYHSLILTFEVGFKLDLFACYSKRNSI